MPYAPCPPIPARPLADVMRWEVARGRVERVGVGVYQIGSLPVLFHVAATSLPATPSIGPATSGGDERRR